MEEEGKDLGAVVGEPSKKLSRRGRFRNGWFVLEPTGHLITPEMIQEIEDELDREELERANALARGERP